MLYQPTIDKLQQLRVLGMAKALEEQRDGKQKALGPLRPDRPARHR